MSKDVNLGKTLVEKSMSRANLGVIISAQRRMSQICLCLPETLYDSWITCVLRTSCQGRISA